MDYSKRFYSWWHSKYSGHPNSTTPEAWDAALNAALDCLDAADDGGDESGGAALGRAYELIETMKTKEI